MVSSGRQAAAIQVSMPNALNNTETAARMRPRTSRFHPA
jgi:hypothetical protein